MGLEDERWELAHFYFAFVAQVFSCRPELVLLLAYVWETVEEVLFDCCGLFDDYETEYDRHEVLTDSLVEDPLVAVAGIACGWMLCSVCPDVKVTRRNHAFFVVSALVVGFSTVLGGLYTYTDDHDFPWGYVATCAIGLAFFLFHGASHVFLAHSLVLVAVPPLLVEAVHVGRLYALGGAAAISMTASAAAGASGRDLRIDFM